MGKRIISKLNIDSLKSSGQTVLRLEPGDILTPLARDTAMELNIKIEDSREPVVQAHATVPAGAPSDDKHEPVVHANATAPAAAPGNDKLEAIVKAVLEQMRTGAQ